MTDEERHKQKEHAEEITTGWLSLPSPEPEPRTLAQHQRRRKKVTFDLVEEYQPHDEHANPSHYACVQLDQCVLDGICLQYPPDFTTALMHGP
jgi:hypothetical protein